MTKQKNNKKPKMDPKLWEKYNSWGEEKLSNIDNKLSYRLKWFVYGGISIVLIAFIVWNLTRSFTGDYQALEIGNIKNETKKLDHIDRNQLKAIKMDRYLNDLKQTHQGKKIYDSLRQARPGLFDSINYYKNRK